LSSSEVGSQSCARQRLEFFGRLFTQFQPLQIGLGLIAQFLPSRLDGKVFLCLGDLGFARVAVLGNQIAGEAGKPVVVYLTFAALADFDHFAGTGKMICRLVA
jgi:hypothetical protein